MNVGSLAPGGNTTVISDPVRLDPNLSNNCDEAKTRLGTGAIRTIGWWSMHPADPKAPENDPTDPAE